MFDTWDLLVFRTSGENKRQVKMRQEFFIHSNYKKLHIHEVFGFVTSDNWRPKRPSFAFYINRNVFGVIFITVHRFIYIH
jgi:hypothetical protein